MNINDCRLQKEFGKITFSKYKKNSVVKELIQCILKNKLESAYYWSAELVCAGHFIVLWDTILTIIGKYIRDLNFKIPNPKSFFLLSKNISNYKINIDIKSNQIKQNIIEILATLNLAPIKNDFEKIETKIVFATIIELTDDKIQKSSLIDVTKRLGFKYVLDAFHILNGKTIDKRFFIDERKSSRY